MSSIVKRSIDAATAQKAVNAAVAKSLEMNLLMSIAVCDEAGHVKAFLRMDGAALLTIQIAQDKAKTAAGYAMATHAWFDFIKNDPPLLHGVVHQPGLIVFGGGYPIKEDGHVIGGMGVSGGHYTQDMDVARAALEAIGCAAE